MKLYGVRLEDILVVRNTGELANTKLMRINSFPGTLAFVATCERLFEDAHKLRFPRFKNPLDCSDGVWATQSEFLWEADDAHRLPV